MRFSIEDPIPLLRRLYGLNPKAKTRFLLKVVGDQMEILPPSVSRGKKDPNQGEFQGETKQDLEKLLDAMDFYGAVPHQIHMVTNHKVAAKDGRARKSILLNSSGCAPKDLKSIGNRLPFLCPADVEWQLEVAIEPTEKSGGAETYRDSIWISNTEICRLIRAKASVAQRVKALRKGTLSLAA
jgi:hypothetical protein